MSFSLVILPNAQREIDQAFEYYAQFSMSAIRNFNKTTRTSISQSREKPYFQVRYKGLRAVPFKSLPFIIFFNIDEELKTVFIYSVFNTYQDPSKYPEDSL